MFEKSFHQDHIYLVSKLSSKGFYSESARYSVKLYRDFHSYISVVDTKHNPFSKSLSTTLSLDTLCSLHNGILCVIILEHSQQFLPNLNHLLVPWLITEIIS